VNAFIALFGGVRGAIAAGVGLVAIVVAGVFGFMWNLESARLDACKAEGQQWADAQTTNLQTIDGLIAKLQEVTARHAANKKAAAKAADKLEAEKAAITKERDQALKGVNDEYAKNPAAKAWAGTAVPRAVADRLPAGTD
jgi:hypothetical protein